jgi:BlaI family penicillinase repressor
MKSETKISDTEWKIMRIVWMTPSVTSIEIISKLKGSDPSWNGKTARTLLSRLVKKKVLRYTPRGHTYFYESCVTEQQCVLAASVSFVERVFGGSLKSAVEHWIKQGPFTGSELDELQMLLLRRKRATHCSAVQSDNLQL